MITTITNIPPLILQYYDRKLLSYPGKLSDDSSKLDHVYQYIKYKIDKKPVGNKVYQLEQEYLELYERIKAKEKDIEGKTEYHTQRPFYYFGRSNRKGQDIFKRLRYKKRRA